MDGADDKAQTIFPCQNCCGNMEAITGEGAMRQRKPLKPMGKIVEKIDTVFFTFLPIFPMKIGRKVKKLTRLATRTP